MIAARAVAVASVVLIGLGQAAAAPAPAEDAVARANALFDEARLLVASGEIARACRRFEESFRLAPRGGTLLNLGLCHEQEGRLVDARNDLKAALDMARRDGRPDREPIATEHLAAVEARLSWLEIVLPPNAPRGGVTLAIDGRKVDGAGTGPVAVDRGKHRVELGAPGFRTATTEIEIGAAPERRTLVLPPLVPLADQPASRRPAPGQLRVLSAPGGARVTLDERFQGTTPLSVGPVEPGAHRVRIEMDGRFPLERDVRLDAAQSLQISVSRDDLLPRRTWAPYVAYGAAVAALVSVSAATLFGTAARADAMGSNRLEAMKDLEQHQQYATIANVLFGAAGIFAAGSLGTFIGLRRDVAGQ